MIAHSGYRIVMSSACKDSRHRAVLQRIVLAVNNNNGALWHNRKDHKLRFRGCYIAILPERYITTIDRYFLLVANASIDKFKGVLTRKYTLDSQAIRAVRTPLENFILIDLGICNI